MARKPKAAPLSSALLVAAGIDGPATDDAGADAPRPGLAKALGRRGPGRKPKPAAGAAGPQGQAFQQPEAEAIPSLIEGGAPAAAASQADTAADSDPAQPGFDPGRSADAAAQPFPEAGAFAPATRAAHWDRTTGRVRFDWPAIERTAAQDGPNQGMAKLLAAARGWAPRRCRRLDAPLPPVRRRGCPERRPAA